MDKIKINGNKKLFGSIKVAGAKNSALPIMVASLLSKDGLYINNLPNLEDIKTMKLLLKSFGLKMKEKNSFFFYRFKKY